MKVNAPLIQKIKKNDRKVILSLYNETFSVLMSVAVRYKKNEEDQMSIVNNSFMKIITKIDQYKLDTSFFSWAKRIAQNESIDQFRKDKNYLSLFHFDAEQENSEESSVVNEIDAEVETEQLERILHLLPPATKLVFNMYAIDGFTSKEIEKELNIKYETVKWHIREARKKLRNSLVENTMELK